MKKGFKMYFESIQISCLINSCLNLLFRFIDNHLYNKASNKDKRRGETTLQYIYFQPMLPLSPMIKGCVTYNHDLTLRP